MEPAVLARPVNISQMPSQLAWQISTIIAEECGCHVWDHDSRGEQRGPVTADELRRVSNRVAAHLALEIDRMGR